MFLFSPTVSFLICNHITTEWDCLVFLHSSLFTVVASNATSTAPIIPHLVSSLFIATPSESAFSSSHSILSFTDITITGFTYDCAGFKRVIILLNAASSKIHHSIASYCLCLSLSISNSIMPITIIALVIAKMPLFS